MPSELRATLAISTSEALTGTSRTLTLPGGRKVTVTVPAGAYNGQVIRVESQAGPLLLSLSIIQAEGSTSAPGPNSEDLTIAASNPYLQTPSASIPNPYYQTPLVTPPSPYLPNIAAPAPGSYPKNQGIPGFYPANDKRPGSQLLSSKAGKWLLVGLAVLIVLSAGIFALTQVTRNSHTNIVATATALAQAHATATARARANAIATFTAANPNPYPPQRGLLVLFDSLRTYRANSGWDQGGGCAFQADGYHVSEPATNLFNDCIARHTNFTNFAYQVTMKIIKGNAGGIIFRADGANSKYYLFRLGEEGVYVLNLYVDSVGSHSRVLNRSLCLFCNLGLNQTNVIAVVAIGKSITLYVNNHQIVSLNDSNYSRGQIGVIAYPYSDPTEVVYTDAKVWAL